MDFPRSFIINTITNNTQTQHTKTHPHRRAQLSMGTFCLVNVHHRLWTLDSGAAD
jgi:hypothetical protein